MTDAPPSAAEEEEGAEEREPAHSPDTVVEGDDVEDATEPPLEPETATIPDPPPLAFLEQPVFALNDNAHAPLAVSFTARTNRADEVELAVAGGGEEWRITIPTIQGAAERPLLGFKPATEYSITASARAGEELVTAAEATFTTPALPNDFPDLSVGISQPDRMEPGMTFFNLRMPGSAYLLVVDSSGEVRWYHRAGPGDPASRGDHEIISNGNIIFDVARWQIAEIDWLGVEQARWYASTWPGGGMPPAGAIPVDTDTFHHEVSELPSGNLLALSSERRTVDEFPANYAKTLTETAEVIGDVLVEFQRDGTIVKKHSLLDVLDPRRLGYGSLGSFWDSSYGMTTRDWSHANAAYYDPVTDSFLVSVRHQDAVVKLRREDGSLWWILGAPDYWETPWSEKLLTPVSSVDWQFHQHGVKVTPGGGVGMFDNGNSHALPPDGQTPADQLNSRAVEFDVDDDQLTVVQAWSYGPARDAPGSFYADFISDADWLPETGNVLITPGGQEAPAVEPGGAAYDFAQIIEVSAGGGRVFELTIKDDPSTARGLTVYRAERVPDIRYR